MNINLRTIITFSIIVVALATFAAASKTVIGSNDAPVAKSDSFEVDEDDTLIIYALSGLLDNDSDADGDSLSVDQVIRETEHGNTK